MEKLLRHVVPKLKPLFITNKNEYSRGRFYDLMVYLYDQYENEFRNQDEVKGALIHGLNDESKMIQDTMAKFWNDKNRLDLDPLTRLQQLMDNMYNNDEEAIWLTNAAYMILKVSVESSDFNRKIFDEPLSECSFEILHLTMN